MRRRTRLIAGLFALVAMTFALAETVLASTCMPGMDMHPSDATVAEQAHAPDCMFAGLHDQQREEGGEDERDCPFSPAAAQTCAGVASLPTYAGDGLAASAESMSVVFFQPTQHDLLLDHALFHPPRA